MVALSTVQPWVFQNIRLLLHHGARRRADKGAKQSPKGYKGAPKPKSKKGTEKTPDPDAIGREGRRGSGIGAAGGLGRRCRHRLRRIFLGRRRARTRGCAADRRAAPGRRE